jgi:myo-inositol-1(or 4)-monophosphatase
VRKAAPLLRRDFGEVEQLQVSRKGPADFVTRADERTEKLLHEELNKARPEFGFLMEEQGEIPGEPGAPRWIIDPLDGTTNFIHGIPQFAISVAVEDNGKLIAGVVYNPITDDFYWAENGRGAWHNSRRLRVSGRKDLVDAVIGTGIPYHGCEGHAEFHAILESVMPEVAGVRRFGAASLDLAMVAAGRLDGFWEAGLKPWDMAAGIHLIQEAGGFISDFAGGADMFDRGDIVVGNQHIHSRLHKLVALALRAQRRSMQAVKQSI